MSEIGDWAKDAEKRDADLSARIDELRSDLRDITRELLHAVKKEVELDHALADALERIARLESK